MTRKVIANGGELETKHAHGRLPQLDGLRAVAILIVVAHHATDRLPIGWVGVELFFVLSGYLITGILWRSRGDKFYWGPFYVKRATRILPPLVPFFIVCALTVSINWKTTGLAYIFFCANILQSLSNAPVTDLTVLWSLAVEEHFYLLWPFAIRYMSRRSLSVLLVAILLVEPIARALATHHVASCVPIYELTCFQLDGLAAGALLALVVQQKRCLGWLARYSGWFSLLFALIFAGCSLDPVFTREQNSVVFNLFGYSLIIMTFAFTLAYLLSKGQSWMSRALSLRPMVFIGAISYGMYLYSGSIGKFVQQGIGIPLHHRGVMGMIKLILEFGLSILLSWVSFHFYETRIIRWGRGKANALRVRGGRTMEAVEMVSGEL